MKQMKTKIYYAVGYAMDDYGSGLVVTDDRKSVSVYKVVGGELIELTELDLVQSDNTQDEIVEHFIETEIVDAKSEFNQKYELLCLTP